MVTQVEPNNEGGGYSQLRGDVRTLSKRRRMGKGEAGLSGRSDYVITSMVIAHLDDLMFVGNREDFKKFQKLMDSIRHGDISMLGADFYPNL